MRSFLNLIEQMIHKTDKTSLNLLSSVRGSVVEVETWDGDLGSQSNLKRENKRLRAAV